jgi:hypothetical protein
MSRIAIGECLDEHQPVTIEHQESKGEVIIRNGESIVAAVDASEFYSAFREVE